LFGLMFFICFYGFSCSPFEPERVKEWVIVQTFANMCKHIISYNWL
jgi:hypothetical protein